MYDEDEDNYNNTTTTTKTALEEDFENTPVIVTDALRGEE